MPYQTSPSPSDARVAVTTRTYTRVRRPRSVGLLAHWLYGLTALVVCAWVLSLPVFPSQDAPLHRYYAHIFAELLMHRPTPYRAFYAIRDYLPPYATYYYALVGLSHFVTLETADKLFVTFSIAMFAVSGFLLFRAVAPHSRWAPFLLLPVLLNWPTFMGFVNYMLSVDLACFAMIAWLRFTRYDPANLSRACRRARIREASLFLLAILLIVITHPLPWMFALGFAGLEMGMRHRRRLHPAQLRRDLVLLLLGCAPYFYLIRFRAKTPFLYGRRFDIRLHRWRDVRPPDFLQRLHAQSFSLLHMHGIVLFLGHGPARPYRLGLNLLLALACALGLWSVLPVAGRLRRPAAPNGSARHLTQVWFLFGCLISLAIVLVPDSFAGGYFFTARLQILGYLAFALASAEALERLPRLARGLAGFAVALSLFTLVLCARYITPVARTVLTVRQIAPVIDPGGAPGLLLRPVGAGFPGHLAFDSYNWAPVDYLRLHELPLYDTPWLGEPLIPLRLTAVGRHRLDPTYFNQAPEYGESPMLNEGRAEALLKRAGFLLLQRRAVQPMQNPFALEEGGAMAAPYADGWQCEIEGHRNWYLCLPRGESSPVHVAPAGD